MKRFLSALVSLLICGTASAQFGAHHLGVRAGIGITKLTNFATNVSGATKLVTEMSFKPGLRIGVADQIRLLPAIPLFVETGLYLDHYGSSFTHNSAGTVKNIYRMGYLKVPALANYHISATQELKFQVFAGPYYGLGAYGTHKVKYRENGDKKKQKYDIFRDNIDAGSRQQFTRSDFGLRVGVAATYDSYYLSIGCDCGLINTAKSRDSRARTLGCFLTAGFDL